MALLLQSQGPCPGKRAPFLSSNIYAFLSHLKDYTPGVLTGWLLESLQQNAVFLWALCSPDLSIYHRERKSVALWSEPCEIPSGFKPSLTPLACAHWHSFLSLPRSLHPSSFIYVFSNSELSASEPHRPSSQISHAPSVAMENKSFWRTFNRCEELLASASHWLSLDQWKSYRALHLICTLQFLLPQFLTRAFESWRASRAPCCFLLIGN